MKDKTAKMAIRKAVLPVAGLGTRFLPATKSIPKEMLPVLDKPLLQYAIEEAKAAGIEEFVFVTGRGKQAIEDHFTHDPELHQFLDERGKRDLLPAVMEAEIEPGQLLLVRQPVPRGLGHALWCARSAIGDEPFAVLLPDDLIISEKSCLTQMVETYHRLGSFDGVGHNQVRPNLLGLIEIGPEESHKYGMVKVAGEDGPVVRLAGLVEKPIPEQAPSSLAIIGRYILQPEIMPLLARHQLGAGGEIQLTDAIAMLLDQQPVYGLRFVGRRFDCGSRNGLLEATLHLALTEAGTAAIVRRACAEAETRS